jgi:uncharacterized protein (DUF2235 family)
MKAKRRLVLCLDGTWNNRDDSTNVLHHFSLAYECNKEERDGVLVTQQRFYNPGVGTGPLDRITGGAFGLGLEEHVRDAYDWLVQNYEDGDAGIGEEADEIYIFGFSRGAYEARSLVGFISMCGLLRRGAPMTVTQLWENYCILGRAREERASFWGLAFGPAVADFRAITSLVWDPWLVHPGEGVPNGVPGQRVNDLNPTEKLLLRCSRRVKITYLGVYDTVGAIGWDALAIPGLRSKLALHNNMRPTTIIQKCRHALAVDENRSSFERTPFVAYIGEKTSEGDSERSGISASTPRPAGTYKMGADKWQKIEAMWKSKIEQRWFVGAHSNIGGGYPDNLLAQHSLHWLLDGARSAGLISEGFPKPAPNTPAQVKPRDSFAEFAPPLWELVLRAKRNYRVIDPPPQLRADRDEAQDTGEPKAGFSLVNINERLDESVLAYWKGSDNPPPNLVGYAERHKGGPHSTAELEAMAGKKPSSPWLAGGFVPHLALVLWATLAAVGLAITDRVFGVWQTSPPPCLLAILAGVFALVDWAESFTNFSFAKGRMSPWKRAFLDAIYWMRALGFVLFVFGMLGSLIHLWHLGWRADSLAAAWRVSWDRIGEWWCVPAGAVAGVILGNMFNKTLAIRLRMILGACATGLLALATIPLVIHTAQAVAHVVLAALGPAQGTAAALPAHAAPGARVAGLLLLAQLAIVYLIKATAWVGGPMTSANLGSITALQKPWTPAGVKACLDRWCKMLGDHHDEKASECGMCAIVGEALWRDVLGYIPVYSIVFGFGFWFGTTQLGWANWWPPLNCLWFVVPLTTLVADYIEDICHFHYLSLHAKRKDPAAWLTVASRLSTQVKYFGVFIEALATLAAILCATWMIGRFPENYGWRGLLGFSISVTTILVLVGLTVWCGIYRILNPPTKFPPNAVSA